MSTAAGDAENGADLALVRRAAAGDPAAFRALVDRHANRLYRLAVSLVGNRADAEDVLQEALAGAYGSLRRFEGRSSVKTWLTRILVTQAALLRRRRRGREPQGVPSDVEAGRSGVPDAAAAKLDLQAALRALPEEQRDVIVLREIDGLSYEQMAEVLGVPRGTVESRLSRARATLREFLKSYGT